MTAGPLIKSCSLAEASITCIKGDREFTLLLPFACQSLYLLLHQATQSAYTQLLNDILARWCCID